MTRPPDTAPDPLSQEALLRHHHGAGDANARRDIKAALAGDTESQAAAQADLAEWRAQDAALAALFPGPGDEIPEAMRRLLDSAADADAAGPSAAHSVARPGLRWRAVVAGVVLFAAGLSSGWLLRPTPEPQGIDLARTALAAHLTYAVEVAHPVEVAASDRDHLVRWLSKRLGQDIHAPDLDAQGFRLLGGRLLPGDPHPAALFMYENDVGQRLTLYVTPETGKNTAFRYVEAEGQKGFWWMDEGLGCAVIAPLGRDALHAVAMAAYDQLI